MAEAIFAAGCFWGVQDRFQAHPGVSATWAGYCGGHVREPGYREVCSGRSGHAEAVRIAFDAQETNYQALLDLFWNLHDPTQYHRQGADVGSQYRSAIFCRDDEQCTAAAQSRDEIAKRFRRPVVTEIVAAAGMIFWPAEDYHQHYIAKRQGRFVP